MKNVDAVRNLRSVSRNNVGGDTSTVLMSSSDNKAFPMLFPKDPKNPSSDPKDWIEFKEDEWKEAYAEAKKRGELYEFTSNEDADRFAKGDWKKKK